MLTLIKHGDVYTPDHLGYRDILLAGGKIISIKEDIKFPSGINELVEINARDCLVMPGFIDQHVHITGGGGEGGPVTRTPEIMLSELTTAGITTVVGLLGIDGITRSIAEVLAKARALEAEGITSYIYTGSYEIPTRTITGNVRLDLSLIDKVIGVGEIAISDHRSSHITYEALAGLAAEARVGGLLAGKAGVVHIHLGEGKRGLSLLFDIVKNSDIPITQFVPTHLNRLTGLCRQAVEYLKLGGNVDLTAGIDPADNSASSLEVFQALDLFIKEGADLRRVTASSDGNGSRPIFDADGNLTMISVGSVKLLWDDISRAVKKNIVPLSTAVSLITKNPAGVLRLLPRKGILAVGSDADLVLVDRDLNIDMVFAGGRLMVDQGSPMVKGFFER